MRNTALPQNSGYSPARVGIFLRIFLSNTVSAIKSEMFESGHSIYHVEETPRKADPLHILLDDMETTAPKLALSQVRSRSLPIQTGQSGGEMM